MSGKCSCVLFPLKKKKKNIYIYIYIHTYILQKKRKRFSIFYQHKVSKITFIGLLETNIYFESDCPRHAIVYIPTADFA